MFYQNQHFGVSEYFCKESGENFSFPSHMHHSFEFITVLQGSMTVSIGDAVYELEKGYGVLIFPEQIHSLKSTCSKHLLTIFSPDIVSTYYARHSREIPGSSIIAIPPYILTQLSTLDEACSIIKIKSILYFICWLLDDSTTYTKKISVEHDLLRKIFDFVENNYNKDCSLSALSKEIGYNGAYISRYFAQATNMTFTSYVNRFKVSKACYILKHSDKTALKCALECGFQSLRNFNRNFKLIIGLSPTEYRKKERKSIM